MRPWLSGKRSALMQIEKASKKSTLSLCMIVKNEEKHLVKCLKSVRDVVDEMIIVDTGSTDKTIDIARVFGAKVFDFPWTGDFSAARNHSLAQATGDWILVLDADEVISARDFDELKALIRKRSSSPVAYSIVTRNYTNNASVIGWTPNRRTISRGSRRRMGYQAQRFGFSQEEKMSFSPIRFTSYWRIH